jgi:catechol 2,3-dioxygenase-like lactoylglutathione lyase family enzyme
MAFDVRGVVPLFQVFDMPASMAFYRDLLGFKVVQTSRPGPVFDWVWLRRNDVEIMLNTAYESDQRPASPDLARIAAYDDTCLYIGAPDVEAVYEHLRGKRIEVAKPKVAH